MSWLDPQRSQEPPSETALRDELRLLLGMKPRNYFESEPTPELIALADDLRREAKRRNHTARKRSNWMLMAAVVPLTLAFGGLGLWGVSQKHKAEDLAEVVARQGQEINRLAKASQQAPPSSREMNASPSQPMLASQKKAPGKPQPKGRELVEQVDRTPGQTPTIPVKAH